MLLCPHYHLLRSRFSARLPISAPRYSRVSPGHWYRQRTDSRSARYIGYDASNSNITTSDGIGFVDGNVKASAIPRNDSDTLKTPSSTTSSPSSSSVSKSHFENTQPPTEESTPPAQLKPKTGRRGPQGTLQTKRRVKGPVVTQPISPTAIRTIIEKGGFRSKLLYRVLPQINDQIQSQKRFVQRRSIRLEALMRLRALYSRELATTQWGTAYGEIYRAKFYKRPAHHVPKVKELGLELVEKVQQDCLGSFREAWESLDKPVKAAHWMRLMFWLLENDQELALEFLLVTTESKDPPNFPMVADSLIYLDYFHFDRLKSWQKDTHTYRSILQACLDPRSWPILTTPQRGVRLYLRRADHEGVCFALKIVNERRVELSAETALCFMRRFTEFGDVDRAIKALEFIPKLKQSGFELDSEGVSRHCSKLLTLDSVVSNEGVERNFRILPRLLKIGVRPDRDMMNVVLSNAFKTGDPQLGLDMLNFMKAQGFELDSFSYITLLSDAVARGDRERVNTLVHEIEPNDELRTNPYLASKMFHGHYVFTVKNFDPDVNPNEVFYAMLERYNQLHDITPLKELSIIPPHYTPPFGSAKSQPSLVALYVMIATYFRCQKRVSNVQRVLHKFRALVAQGHPAIAPLAATDHTYNEFLIAFRDDPRGLRSCVRLVEEMLQSGTVTTPQTENHESTTVTLAKPTVRTWTILLSAFIYNKQPLAAEKVKEMMSKYGVKFNEVTWNVVINGYANSQNIPAVAKTMKMMEDQGFPIDSYTMKSLRYLRDPERLWVAVEELDKAALSGPTPWPSSQTESAEEDEVKEREKLLDQGLKRLEAKMNPKL